MLLPGHASESVLAGLILQLLCAPSLGVLRPLHASFDLLKHARNFHMATLKSAAGSSAASCVGGLDAGNSCNESDSVMI